jgi:hypothetical protein
MEDDLMLSFYENELYRDEKLKAVAAAVSLVPDLADRWKSHLTERKRELVRWKVRKSRVVGDDPYSDTGVWFHSKFVATLARSPDGRSLDFAKLTWKVQGRKTNVPRVEYLELESLELKTLTPGGRKRERTTALGFADCVELFRELSNLLDVHPFFEHDRETVWVREGFLGHAGVCVWHKCGGLNRLLWCRRAQKIDPSLTEQCAAVIAGVDRPVWEIRSEYAWLPEELVELLCASSKLSPNDLRL